jgi:hypothetical protein
VINPEMNESRAGADNVRDRVLSSYLVEAYTFGGYPVHDPFRNGNPSENSKGERFHVLAQRAAGNQIHDFGMIATMLVMMAVRVLFMPCMGMTVVMLCVIAGVVMMMGCLDPFISVMSGDQKAPSRDAVAITALKSASGKNNV